MLQSLLKSWLRDQAYPFWASHGVDRENGSFFELMKDDFTPLESPRRARLTARQIYCFSVAREAGWHGDGKTLADMGLSFLKQHLIRDDASVRRSVFPDGTPADDGLDLYDDAFVLFALATVVDVFGRNPEIENLARCIAETTEARARRADGAFQDAKGSVLANPNMHLMEAFLAWCEAVPDAAGYWSNLASRQAQCALEHMIQLDIASLPEHFGDDWVPVPDDLGLLVEPVHQFEWAWLLARWACLSGDRQAFQHAMTIGRTGERFGIDIIRKIAINAIDEKQQPRDMDAKLWPQTERAKFWHAVSLHPFATLQEKSHAEICREEALKGLNRFIEGCTPGLWREILLRDDNFADEPVRASSFYHIVCAIITVNRPYVTAGFKV